MVHPTTEAPFVWLNHGQIAAANRPTLLTRIKNQFARIAPSFWAGWTKTTPEIYARYTVAHRSAQLLPPAWLGAPTATNLADGRAWLLTQSDLAVPGHGLKKEFEDGGFGSATDGYGEILGTLTAEGLRGNRKEGALSLDHHWLWPTPRETTLRRAARVADYSSSPATEIELDFQATIPNRGALLLVQPSARAAANCLMLIRASNDTDGRPAR
jgi:hypothetical protein